MTESMITQTQQAILESAGRHFLKYGFLKASLNRIVADSGFTKGAFYGYYVSKEELFCALVHDTVSGLQTILGDIVAEWKRFPKEEQINHMTEEFLSALPRLVDFIFANRDGVILLLRCADGTCYENFLTDLQSIDVREGQNNMQSAFGTKLIGEDTYRIMMLGYFSMLKEVFLSDMPKEQMISAITDIQMMYQNGIMALINEKRSNSNG